MCSREDYEHLGAVAVATTPGAVLADPTEAIRAGVSEPPYWAVIHPSGLVSLIHGRPSLADLQGAVDGYIEAVPHGAPEGGTLTAYCNEYGKERGMTPNRAATGFLRVVGDYLAGPVVVIGGPDRWGNDQPLTGAARSRLVMEVIEA